MFLLVNLQENWKAHKKNKEQGKINNATNIGLHLGLDYWCISTWQPLFSSIKMFVSLVYDRGFKSIFF